MLINRIEVIVLMGLALASVSCSSKSSSGVAGPASADQASSVLNITNVGLVEAGGDVDLQVASDHEPKYNVFKLTDPDKVVVDLIDAKLGASIPTSIPGKGDVQEIKVTSLEDSLSSVVRIEMLLKTSSNYIASVDNNTLKVKILSTAALAQGQSAPAPMDAPGALVAPVPIPLESAAPAPLSSDLKPLESASAPLDSAPLPPELSSEMKATSADAMSAQSMAAAPESAAPPAELSAPAPSAMPEMSAPLPVPLPEMNAEGSSAAPTEEPKADNFPPAQPLPEATPLKAEEENKSTGSKETARNSKILKGVATQEIPSTGLTEGTSLLTELDTKVYTGRRVSLEFQDADVQDVLRLIADVSRLNIVTGDDVKGKLTLKLVDVPWDQALDIILTTLSLDKIQHGNILRVAPVEKLKKEREVALANDKAARQLEPVRIKLLNVNYATADEMKDRIKNLLSERGTVDTDPRTNTLIIKDIREHISRVENLVKALDTQTPQVRIESRIVIANDTFTKSVGVQWGPSFQMSSANNRQRSWAFPRDIDIGTRAGTDDTFSQPNATALSNFAVDALPGSAGSALGFRLGSIGNIFNLDLRLQYAESENLARIVSRPSVTVLDNRSAKIIQGTKLPFTTSSSDGTNVQFQEAGIEISVTPQITSDGAVIMKVSTKANEPTGEASASGQAISIREAQTEMLVKSAQTAVLGGVFKQNETKGKSGVPYLMDIPVLGWLFKGVSRSESREETLIFLTPYILNDLRTASTAPTGANDTED